MPLHARCHQDETGLSLVEMLVAVLMLGLILGAMAQSLVGTLTSITRQEGHIKASALANELLEQVRSVVWEDAGLCETEAVNHFGGTTVGGQDLATIPDGDPTCSTPDPNRLVPLRTLVRDGVTYTAVTTITWMDDPVDNGSGDADPHDVKRVVVDLAWTNGSDPFTFRAETVRAPSALEIELDALVDPDITYIKNNPDSSSVVGANITAFDLRATATAEQTSVTAKWTDRAGTIETRNLTSSDGGFSWLFQVPQNVGPFRNGETVFTFTATDPAGNQIESIHRALFLHTLEVLSLTPPAKIQVRGDGTVCPFTVSTHVRGALLSDEATLSFSPGPVNQAMLADTTDENGAFFDLALDGETGWGSTETSTTITLTLNRIADASSVTSQVSVPLERGVVVCGA